MASVMRGKQIKSEGREREREREKRLAFSLVVATLHPLFFASLSLSLSFLAFTLFVLHYARRHRRRLCGLPHAMVATLLPKQLLSSVGFIDNSQAKQRFRGWRDDHDRITNAREGRGVSTFFFSFFFSSNPSRLRVVQR